MAPATGATVFVTGAAGFVGTELVKVLVARGSQVFGLAPTLDAAERVRLAGAKPLIGNLLEAGPWQDAAAAEWVFHLPPHPRERQRARATWTRAAAVTRDRVLMDMHLLDAIHAGPTRRIVYVGDTSCYGATGQRPITEDEPPRPSPWGRCLAPALDRVEGYLAAGTPIVIALPGWIYGNGSWFRERVIEPVLAGRHVLQFGKTGPWISAVHVHDCARALVYLAERGEIGGRYFVVNTDPIRMNELAETFARLANRPLKVRRVPTAASRLVVGPLLADSLSADAAFSNIRLRGIGFRFHYPTLEQGLEQVVGGLDG
jgi:nucleoside-diphosphate-sugar epimerase